MHRAAPAHIWRHNDTDQKITHAGKFVWFWWNREDRNFISAPDFSVFTPNTMRACKPSCGNNSFGRRWRRLGVVKYWLHDMYGCLFNIWKNSISNTLTSMLTKYLLLRCNNFPCIICSHIQLLIILTIFQQPGNFRDFLRRLAIRNNDNLKQRLIWIREISKSCFYD